MPARGDTKNRFASRAVCADPERTTSLTPGHAPCIPDKTINAARAMNLVRRLLRQWWTWALLMVTACCATACVQGQVATDTGDPGFPFGPSTVGPQTLAYVQNIKPIFDLDCASCHGVRENAGNYSVSTYANVLSGQRPGDARSPVVVD